MTTAEESRTRTRWWHEAVTAVPDEAAAETAEVSGAVVAHSIGSALVRSSPR